MQFFRGKILQQPPHGENRQGGPRNNISHDPHHGSRRKKRKKERAPKQSPLDPLFSEDTRTVSIKANKFKGDPNVNRLKHRRPQVTEPSTPFQRILTDHSSHLLLLTPSSNQGPVPLCQYALTHLNPRGLCPYGHSCKRNDWLARRLYFMPT